MNERTSTCCAPPGPGGRKVELEEMECGCEGAKKGTQPWNQSVSELWRGDTQKEMHALL